MVILQMWKLRPGERQTPPRSKRRLENNPCIHSLKSFLKSFLFFLVAPKNLISPTRILGPPPCIKPSPPALEGQSLNHWATREVPEVIFLRTSRLFLLPAQPCQKPQTLALRSYQCRSGISILPAGPDSQYFWLCRP